MYKHNMSATHKTVSSHLQVLDFGGANFK